MSLAESPSADVGLEEISRIDFWKSNFPELTINDRLGSWNRGLPALSGETSALYSARMAEEGYFQDKNETFGRLAPGLADAVATCKRLGIPPTFIFLFDETWECFYALNPMLTHFLGERYKVLPDFWTWHVDPKAAEAGWRPHRDKGKFSLSSEGKPLSLTVWAPLTEATPQNGCMYILPANKDPVYNTADEKAWQVDMTAIRALPAKPGDFLCWNQAVLHWGSQTSRFAPHPRLSMALEFQRGDTGAFNTPLLEPFSNFSFDDRLRLVGKQILQYRHMYPLAPRFETMAKRLTGQS